MFSPTEELMDKNFYNTKSISLDDLVEIEQITYGKDKLKIDPVGDLFSISPIDSRTSFEIVGPPKEYKKLIEHTNIKALLESYASICNITDPNLKKQIRVHFFEQDEKYFVSVSFDDNKKEVLGKIEMVLELVSDHELKIQQITNHNESIQNIISETEIKNAQDILKQALAVTNTYEKHLLNQINKEIKSALKNKTLDELKMIFNNRFGYNNFTPDEQAKINNSHDKNQIINELLKHSKLKESFKNSILDACDLKEHLVVQKYEIISAAKYELIRTDRNTLPKDRITKFQDILSIPYNVQTLKTRRDSAFITFIKGLAMAGATLTAFTGVGIPIAIYAYKNLFGSKATKGSQFLNKKEQVISHKKKR